MKNFCFAYFEHAICSYTPLDLAYAKARILEVDPSARIEIVKISAPSMGLDISAKIRALKKEAQKLSKIKADTFFITLDNVMWSTMFYGQGAGVLSRELKKINPAVRIGFHSYKLSDGFARKMFKEIPEIDFCVRGEPEKSLVEFVRSGSYEKVPGFVYRKKNQDLQINREAPLLKNLDELPSPYLSGTLDHFIETHPGVRLFMATSRGCPFECHYCHRSTRFSKVRTFSIERVLDELEYLAQRGVANIFMLDDCFIVDHQRFFDLVTAYEERFKNSDLVLPNLVIMSRPEFLSDEILELLPKIKVACVQIGLQTLHPDSQYLMGRGCEIEDFERIAESLYQQGIRLQLDIILGLPNDTLEYFRKTFDFAIDLMPSTLQVKQLFRGPNTLFDLYPERYGLKSETKKQLFNVPIVHASNTFSNKDIEQAAEHVLEYRNRNMLPRIKLITEFVRFNDYGVTGKPGRVVFSDHTYLNPKPVLVS